MLLDSHEISQNLCRVEFVGQAVPDWNASMTSQLLNCPVIKPAKFNTIKHAAQHLGGVFNCFFFTQLNVIFAEVFWRDTQVISRHRKGTARAS